MKYKTVMLDIESFARLAHAKRVMREKSGKKLSFNDVIMELVGRRLEFAQMDERLREYVKRFALEMGRVEGVEGVLLFGSVAKMTYGEYSDIDVLVLARGGKWAVARRALDVARGMREYGERLMAANLPSLINPIVLDAEDLKSVRPFYFDFADYGIILYERGTALSDLIRTLKGISHKRELVNNVEVLTW